MEVAPPYFDTHPWDGFLVGPENTLAFAALQALARAEPVAAAPLVIHGPSGSGKTRLLAGLVTERIRRRPGAAVAHLDAAEWIAPDSPETSLARRIHEVELLVLDNLGALDRSPTRLVELGHLLDTLDTAGGVAAVAAAQPPPRWPVRWPSRLVSRLRGGLVVGLEPPGQALLRRHALERARQLGLALEPEALDTLTTHGGFRELDGQLARMHLAARLGQHKTPIEDKTLPRQEPDAAIAAIARQVARRFNLRLTDLRGPDRHAALVGPRHLAIYLARQHTRASFARLGRYFGARDTKTIRHACRVAHQRIDVDPALAAIAQECTDLLTVSLRHACHKDS